MYASTFCGQLLAVCGSVWGELIDFRMNYSRAQTRLAWLTEKLFPFNLLYRLFNLIRLILLSWFASIESVPFIHALVVIYLFMLYIQLYIFRSSFIEIKK